MQRAERLWYLAMTLANVTASMVVYRAGNVIGISFWVVTMGLLHVFRPPELKHGVLDAFFGYLGTVHRTVCLLDQRIQMEQARPPMTMLDELADLLKRKQENDRHGSSYDREAWTADAIEVLLRIAMQNELHKEALKAGE